MIITASRQRRDRRSTGYRGLVHREDHDRFRRQGCRPLQGYRRRDRRQVHSQCEGSGGESGSHRQDAGQHQDRIYAPSRYRQHPCEESAERDRI